MNEQPKPKPTDLMPTWTLVTLDLERMGEHEVINDCVVRDQQGFDKYKCRLTPFNGRDSLRDAFEESMDLVVYLKNVIMESPPVVPSGQDFREVTRLYHQAIGIMCGLKDRMDRLASAKGKDEFQDARDAFQEVKYRKVELPCGPIYSERYPKPQDAPGRPIASHGVEHQPYIQEATTWHPDAFQGVSVEVANLQPTIFIPPQIQGPVREELERWKEMMDASLEAEREKYRMAQVELSMEGVKK